jgi:hypothetical protein
MRLPSGEQATLGGGRTRKDTKKSHQRVVSSTRRLTGSEDSCRGCCVGGVELDYRGIEEPAFSVGSSQRKGSRLL